MNISSLRERSPIEPISVSTLNTMLKSTVEASPALAHVYVRGEISNFVAHTSGHYYFTLKDSESQIGAVMFRSSVANLRFKPQNGMKVTVTGSVSVYVAGGKYQIYVQTMQPDGIGALYLAYEQLKNKLAAEGLFDEVFKKPIPRFPSRVGVITSPTGAAVRDIIRVAGRRCPAAEIVVSPALVQGDGAEASLLSALRFLDTSGKCDVIILGRGGGSLEDLYAFNSEKLARAVFAAKTPIISAVGHERDFTICDFVADLRAPTPSAAAELAVPDVRELMQRLDVATERLRGGLLKAANDAKERLLRCRNSIVFTDPTVYFKAKYNETAEMQSKLVASVATAIKEKRGLLAPLGGTLNALSPLSVLDRGYSITEKTGVPIRSASDLQPGEVVGIRFKDGAATAKITAINPPEEA